MEEQCTSNATKERLSTFAKKAKKVLGKFFLKTSLGQCLFMSAIICCISLTLGLFKSILFIFHANIGFFMFQLYISNLILLWNIYYMLSFEIC